MKGLASLAGLSLGVSFATQSDVQCFAHNPNAKRDSYTSPRPLTKRQRRRLRGKQGGE